MNENQVNNSNNGVVPQTTGVTPSQNIQPPAVDNTQQASYQIPGVVIAPPMDNSSNPRVVEQVSATATGVANDNSNQQPVVAQQAPANKEVPVNQGETNTATVPPANQVPANNAVTPPVEAKKKKSILPILMAIVIIGLIGYIVFSTMSHNKEVSKLKEECTPVSTSGETKELDLKSTIVLDLYSKVKTNIREDLANFNFDDEMKVYLAYRQMANDKIYNSNCNYFNDTKMYAFSCKESANFIPTAFKEEDLVVEYKKLFGETATFVHDDIQLANSCLGGYQYIAERGEYVKGDCGELATTTFKVNKELVKATSTESTIVLYEKVKFYGSEGKEYPEKLKSGTYKYTFKLDQNYNYVLINREYEI